MTIHPDGPGEGGSHPAGASRRPLGLSYLERRRRGHAGGCRRGCFRAKKKQPMCAVPHPTSIGQTPLESRTMSTIRDVLARSDGVVLHHQKQNVPCAHKHRLPPHFTGCRWLVPSRCAGVPDELPCGVQRQPGCVVRQQPALPPIPPGVVSLEQHGGIGTRWDDVPPDTVALEF